MPAVKQVYISIPQQEILNNGGMTVLAGDDPATDSDGASSAASSRYSTSKGLRGTKEARGAPHKELATKVPSLGGDVRQDPAERTQKEAQEPQPSQEEAKLKAKGADKAERILRERMNPK